MSTVFAFLPLVILVALGVWGGLMKKKCPFFRVKPPFWPDSENPGLALELAASSRSVDDVLGAKGTHTGDKNRESAKRFQYYDFVFILLYVLFFAITAWVLRGCLFAAKAATLLAILTGGFDVLEDVAILSILSKPGALKPRYFGQPKWLCYFLAMGAEGALFLTGTPTLADMVFGAVVILIAMGGAISALKASFDGITTATALSFAALLGLALAPPLALTPLSWHIIGEYVVLLRVSLIFGLFLLTLPVIAFLTGARSLFRGLFDLTPLSILVVTVATVALSAMACTAAQLVLSHSPERFRGLGATYPVEVPLSLWLLIMFLLSLPVIVSAVVFSGEQRRATIPRPHSPTGACVLGAIAGLALSFAIASGLIPAIDALKEITDQFTQPHVAWFYGTGLFVGYIRLDNGVPVEFYTDHLRAAAAYAVTILVYALLGFYGYRMLGKRRTVPALCSALMLITMLGWTLSALTFFFDAWRIPTLLIVVIVGVFTSQSRQSDHYYNLRARSGTSVAPLNPAETLRRGGSRRVIVVAANGGGIQAGAWAARVLFSLLQEHGAPFHRRLRMISSISGGSVGSSYVLHWLSKPKDARLPDQAAAESSLDEVAWGLAWPDFLRSVFPWISGRLIGRGRALEKAWCMNGALAQSGHGDLDKPLSDWNDEVAKHDLPAIVMNATICETGERLVLATTGFGNGPVRGRARVDACELHRINGVDWDVGIVTAARLSASFTYVTPVSRSNGAGPQPHIADGGYYDNYGMASLVEWLDAGLEETQGEIDRVLVIQIHGAPVTTDLRSKRQEKGRGWFYQILAPITTLLEVRSAGQVAHNDIELQLLKQKWQHQRVIIDGATFEFPDPNAPLSWHLTPTQIQEIERQWEEDKKVAEAKAIVRDFLREADAQV